MTCICACTGECEGVAVEELICINSHARPRDYEEIDSKLRNFQLATASHQNLFTDATIIVGGHDFWVHRAVLANASPYFERMFSTEMQEGETACYLYATLLSSDRVSITAHVICGRIHNQQMNNDFALCCDKTAN